MNQNPQNMTPKLNQNLQNPGSQVELSELTGVRGAFLDCIDDPFSNCSNDSLDNHSTENLENLENSSIRYIADGLLVLNQGHIHDFGAYSDLADRYPNLAITHYPDRLITPGLVDVHLHYPQTQMMAAYGEQLLDWLNQYTFPTEQTFQDPDHAAQVANFFIEELLRNGTTTAAVFAAVFPGSVDALFTAAQARNLRLVTGKVMMDRHAPPELLDTAQSAYEDSQRLIETWHGIDRLSYAVTPRFAPTSTPQQLQFAGQLLSEFPTVYLHTHLSENVDELAWVKELFPNSESYLDVYDRYGLVNERSIFAHCIHLSDAEFDRLDDINATIAFCPTSNLFLGSGLFNIQKAKSEGRSINVGLASDVGAGTSFSMLKTAAEAYKVAQLQRQTLSPFQLFFLMTLGGARSLHLADQIGNFAIGKEADFVVWHLQATPLMDFRNAGSFPTTLQELSDRLFSLLVLGDDRSVSATYIMGNNSLDSFTASWAIKQPLNQWK
ncbi:guanine deaminase [Alkalinema pantanalense CENA528]|uniref:guanine deaminase n=1 Tax=Alkalinema pantanalense TaxID=1620705 RepID=UPI003D6E3BA9